MASWRSVGDEGMLSEGAMAGIEVEGQGALLVRVDGVYRAYQRKCPHLGADLSQGKLRSGVIVCPWHGSRFDATTGANLAWAPKLPGLAVSVGKLFRPPRALASYAVKVEAGQVWIDTDTIEEKP